MASPSPGVVPAVGEPGVLPACVRQSSESSWAPEGLHEPRRERPVVDGLDLHAVLSVRPICPRRACPSAWHQDMSHLWTEPWTNRPTLVAPRATVNSRPSVTPSPP
jgi:hypothetical protein